MSTNGIGKARLDIGEDGESAAFTGWRREHEELGSYLTLGMDISTGHYEKMWREVEDSSGSPDRETYDIFESMLGNAPPLQMFQRMFLASIVKDAVTLLEVFLEKCADAAARNHGKIPKERTRTPEWRHYESFFKQFDVRPFLAVEPMKTVLLLRNVLTHRRGDLRTPEEQTALRSDDPFAGPDAAIDQQQVITVLQNIRDFACMIEEATRPFTTSQKQLANFADIDSHRKPKDRSGARHLGTSGGATQD